MAKLSSPKHLLSPPLWNFLVFVDFSFFPFPLFIHLAIIVQNLLHINVLAPKHSRKTWFEPYKIQCRGLSKFFRKGKIGGLTERNCQPRILHSRICQIKIVLDFLKIPKTTSTSVLQRKCKVMKCQQLSVFR